MQIMSNKFFLHIFLIFIFNRQVITSKISDDSPDWFKIYNKEQLNKINEQYKANGDNLHMFSKFKRWITVTPSNKNRKKPLESIKTVKYFKN